MERDQTDEFLRPFYRLYLYSPAQLDGSSWEIHACPDREQRGSATESVAIIPCEDLGELASILSILGVEGRSGFIGEGPTGPKSRFERCSIDSVVASLISDPPSPHRHVTLIAPRTPIPEMRKRLARLPSKQRQVVSQ